MIHLNIIPEKIKNEIKLRFFYKVSKKFLYLLIIIASVIGIVLMTSEFILYSFLAKEISNSPIDFKSSLSTSQNKVTDINTKINLLEKMQGNFIQWTILLNSLTNIIPEEIRLNSLSINRDPATISFNGTANKRDDLLNFKEALEGSILFENIDFPIQNLLQKENINFEIKAKLKLDEVN